MIVLEIAVFSLFISLRIIYTLKNNAGIVDIGMAFGFFICCFLGVASLIGELA